jgi:hypothetical protein
MGDAFTRAYGPPDSVPRYRLYPPILVDVLAAQLNETVCWTGGGSAVAVKFTPVMFAPFKVFDAVDGENEYPDWLGATRYVPFARPEKL